MAMKAYACPRCLTLYSTTEDGDGGPHICTPTPMMQKKEERIDDLEHFILRNCDPFDMTKADAAVFRGIQHLHP